MKARIRSEIFSALDQQDDAPNRAPLSNTNLLLNELIREYLAFNQYRYTLNVFLPEANQPEVPPFDRAFISKELHVQENQHSVQMSVQRERTECDMAGGAGHAAPALAVHRRSPLAAHGAFEGYLLTMTFELLFALCVHSPLLYSIVALLQQGKVADSVSDSSGRCMQPRCARRELPQLAPVLRSAFTVSVALFVLTM